MLSPLEHFNGAIAALLWCLIHILLPRYFGIFGFYMLTNNCDDGCCLKKLFMKLKPCMEDTVVSLVHKKLFVRVLDDRV